MCQRCQDRGTARRNRSNGSCTCECQDGYSGDNCEFGKEKNKTFKKNIFSYLHYVIICTFDLSEGKMSCFKPKSVEKN